MIETQQLRTPSTPRRVTFFEDRAEVVRTSTVSLSSGVSRVRIEGVSLFVDDRSVQVRVSTDGVEVLAARVVRVRVAEPDDPAQDLHAAVQQADDAHRGSVQAAARTKASLARSRALLAAWLTSVTRAPTLSGDLRGQWAEAGQSVLEQGASLSARSSEAHWQTTQTAKARAHARDLLAAARAESTEFVAEIEVQLDTEVAGDIEIQLTYRTPAALWRPEHLLRLVQVDGADSLHWTMMATSWQITGEDWTGVEARYSTARPASAAGAPRLRDDVLHARRKSDEERKSVHVESRDMSVETARAHGRGAAEMMGVDDGGTPVLLHSPGAVDLPSTGEPHRVSVGEQEIPVTVRRVLYPELGAVAHFAARGVLTGGHSMLAGPAHIARGGSFVGRTRVDFTAVGEPFEIGMGPDDGVRVRRKLKNERERTAVLGTQTITRRVFVFVSNLSDDARALHVVERVPVSEIDAVKVRVTDAVGWEWDQRDGFLSRDVHLKGRETREFELAWEVKAGSDVVLPF